MCFFEMGTAGPNIRGAHLVWETTKNKTTTTKKKKNKKKNKKKRRNLDQVGLNDKELEKSIRK